MLNVFDLVATITLDRKKYDEELDKSGKDLSSFGSKLSSGLKTAGTVAAGAIAAGATAVGAIAKQAVDAYGNFEQLSGGVKKLFGAAGQSLEEYAASQGKTVDEVSDEYQKLIDSQITVFNNADKAFATAGMSANEYMETVTGFSAALINSVGGDTQKAAELADMAIRDMSDNANTFGSDMESIQNAYSGFSRGNFTMLDNLKLGFAGTKEGMQQLLDKAKELTGQDYNIESYADIVEAIHAVQKAQNIAGTTAKEAAGTIQGSLASTKAAWQNLMVAMADGQDLEGYMDDLVESASNVVDNIIPIFEQALQGIGQFIEKVAPVISEKLPGLISTLLPVIVSAAQSLLTSIASALPELLNVLLDILPNLIQTGMQMTISLFQGFAEKLPEMIQQIVQVISTIIETLTNPDNLAQLITAAVQIIIALANGLIQAIPSVVAAIPNIILAIVKAIEDSAPQIASAGMNLLKHLGDKVGEVGTWLLQKAKTIPSKIANGLKNVGSSFINIGKNWLSGIWSGFVEKWNTVKDSLSDWGSNVVGFVKSVFGISSPSKVFAEIGGFMNEGLIKGLDDGKDKVLTTASSMANEITGAFTSPEVVPFMGSGSATAMNTATTRKNVPTTVILELDRVQLAKTVFNLYEGENSRMGVNLAGGMA